MIKSENLLKNHRPITIINSLIVPIVKKIFDSAMEQSNFVSNIYSYVKGKSAMDAITYYYDFALSKVTKKLIFFKTDYENCFDEILANYQLKELLYETDLSQKDKDFIWFNIVNKSIIVCDGMWKSYT